MLLTRAYRPGNWYISHAAHRRLARETERGIERALQVRATMLGHAPDEIPHIEVAPGRPD